MSLINYIRDLLCSHRQAVDVATGKDGQYHWCVVRCSRCGWSRKTTCHEDGKIVFVRGKPCHGIWL